MGKLGLGSKLNQPKASPTAASQPVDSKLSRQHHDDPAVLGKAVAATVMVGPVEAGEGRARRPARAAPAQIVVRSTPKFRRAIRRWALDEDTSVQDLILTALREMYRAKGLGELPE